MKNKFIIIISIITIISLSFGTFLLFNKSNDEKEIINNEKSTENEMVNQNKQIKAKIEQDTFENWQLVKIKNEETNEIIGKELVQTLNLKEQNNARILQFSFIYDKANKKVHAKLIFPLGVYLPAGFGIKIDEKEITKIPYIMCDKNGCISDVIFEDDLIDYVKNKENGIVAFLTGDKKQINLPVSFKGFSKGLEELKK